MRNLLLVAGLVAATAIPAMANAATRCEQHQADNRAAGTVIGAIAGGLLGNAVSHGGGRTGGTVIGAVGGAVVGNQLARSNNACPDGYVAYNGPDRDPAAYYGSDAQEDAYYRQYGHHSDGFMRYQHDMASAYVHDTGSYSDSDTTWRDANGRMCHWRQDSFQTDDGGMSYRWVQDCH